MLKCQIDVTAKLCTIPDQLKSSLDLHLKYDTQLNMLVLHDNCCLHN